MSPYTHLSAAALPVVPYSLVLVVALDRNMRHSTTTKVAESNSQEISNLFTMNAAFLRNALTLLNENSSVQNHPF